MNATREDLPFIDGKLASDIKVEDSQPGRLEYIDPHHITKQIAVKPVFRTAGDFANRWLII